MSSVHSGKLKHEARSGNTVSMLSERDLVPWLAGGERDWVSSARLTSKVVLVEEVTDWEDVPEFVVSSSSGRGMNCTVCQLMCRSACPECLKAGLGSTVLETCISVMAPCVHLLLRFYMFRANQILRRARVHSAQAQCLAQVQDFFGISVAEH